MSRPAFLGVTSSALGRRWADRLDERAAREAAAIAAAHGLSDALARILAGRGVTVTGAPAFLGPRLRETMPDPSSLVDLDRAVLRLRQALLSRETIAIFGDYDVDGACSAALLANVLTEAGALPPIIHIPDRLTEGYGPNGEAIRQLAGQGATLLVCVDCGTSGHAPLAEAKALGLDVLVLDHHQAPEHLPDVLALVNPNRQDDLSGLGHLCAAGVVFLTLVGLVRALREGVALPPLQGEGRGGVDKARPAPSMTPTSILPLSGGGRARPLPDLMAHLDLVALATVADVVPLTGLNRAFVAQGLKVMAARRRPGLAALADVARLEAAPEAWHLGFLIGPRINAGGRIGDSGLGARLLTTGDAGNALRIAADLDRLNRERQAVEEAMLAEAEAEALAMVGMDESQRAVLVVAGETWHPGIVGIVAGRLKERFRRPAFAIAAGEASPVGSGRSIAGVDLGRAVREAVAAGLAVKGGGHAMAAGITLGPGGVEAFRDFLEARLGPAVAAARGDDPLLIDVALSAESLTVELCQEIARAGPFGQGNPEPLLALPGHRLADVIEMRNGHLKAILASPNGARIEAMAFRAAGRPLGDALAKARGRTIHVAAHAARDDWGGKPRVSLRLVDLAIVP